MLPAARREAGAELGRRGGRRVEEVAGPQRQARRAGEGKGREAELFDVDLGVRAIGVPARGRHQFGISGAGGEGDLVGEAQPGVVSSELLRREAGQVAELVAPMGEGRGEVPGFGVGAVAWEHLVEAESVGGDAGGNAGALVGAALDAAGPDLAPQVGRNLAEVQRAAGFGVPSRRGVRLPPAVVVLRDGAQQLLPLRVVDQLWESDEAEEVGGEASVIGLGDDPEAAGERADDQGKYFRFDLLRRIATASGVLQYVSPWSTSTLPMRFAVAIARACNDGL